MRTCALLEELMPLEEPLRLERLEAFCVVLLLGLHQMGRRRC